jgi:uncharacterized membrane protein
VDQLLGTPHKGQHQRRVFVAILVGWNLVTLVLVLVELSIRDRPNVQIGASTILRGTLTVSWVMVNLAILTTALVVRCWGKTANAMLDW